MFKYIASVPIVLSVIAGAYGGLNYVNKLTTQIDESTKQIMLLSDLRTLMLPKILHHSYKKMQKKLLADPRQI